MNFKLLKVFGKPFKIQQYCFKGEQAYLLTQKAIRYLSKPRKCRSLAFRKQVGAEKFYQISQDFLFSSLCRIFIRASWVVLPLLAGICMLPLTWKLKVKTADTTRKDQSFC